MKLFNLLFFVFFFEIYLPAQDQDAYFENLNSSHGLSNDITTCIIQDRLGFMWVGTMNGLNKYDGYKFTVYKYDVADSLSISDNWITALCEDYLGNLWIGTANKGLNRYDRDSNSFIRYVTEDKLVNTIFETREHELWIGGNGSLNHYIRKNDSFRKYYPDENTDNLQANVNFVQSITQDSKGRLWIGTWNEGIFYYEAEKDTFLRYQPLSEYSKMFKNQYTDELYSTKLDGKDYLWFATYPNGLYKINITTGDIFHYTHQPDNPNSIGTNSLNSLYQPESNDKIIWVGTDDGGLNKLNIRTGEFTHYRHQQGDNRSLVTDNITCIFEDKSGLLWLGTSQGVDKFTPQKKLFSSILLDENNPDNLSGNWVTDIYESVNNDRSIIWIGTFAGLYSLDRNTRQLTRFTYNPHSKNSLSSDKITHIYESGTGSQKILWISTYDGLNKIELQSKRIKRYYIPHKDPVRRHIHVFCEDKKVYYGLELKVLIYIVLILQTNNLSNIKSIKTLFLA